MTTNSKPSRIIKIDKHTDKIVLPTILLQTRSFKTIGKLNYTNFNASLVANGIDEISFEIHKYVDGRICPIWDDIEDLKLVKVEDYGRFQIRVSYTDSTETVKAIHGQSLEVELGQLILNNFHVNDDEATDMVYTDYSKDNYDKTDDDNYVFVPTAFYNDKDPKRSLLHRVLEDKAPHWKIGHVPTWVSMSEDDVAELAQNFERIYTVDGTSIYDFLTGEVAKETNVIFVFDTLGEERIINCYSLIDCYDESGKLVEHAYGKDTNILVSKKNLANEISIESNQDELKNCFRIEGGDDLITASVAAVNMNGTNYIWCFSDLQLRDMSEELRNKIQEYQRNMSSQETKDLYYGENGIYTRLCNAYEELYQKESSLMPTITAIDPGDAKTQYEKVVNALQTSTVYVTSLNNYSADSHVGLDNMVVEYASVFMDSRFEIEVINDKESNMSQFDKNAKKWKGKIKITQRTDSSNTYPTIVDEFEYIEVSINDKSTENGELEFVRQKTLKALAESDMQNFDFTNIDVDEARSYFEQFALNRLTSFYDAYNRCLSIMGDFGVVKDEEDERRKLYNEYYKILTVIGEVKKVREQEVANIKIKIGNIEAEQIKFQNDEKYNFEKFLGEELYSEFCLYRREDTYSNSNYISDNLNTTAEQLEKAQELLKVAEAELKKACVLQRTVSASLNNLLALPEFEPLYEEFALYNFIRIKTEDEIIKLRLIKIEFDGDSIESINVTFSEQIESVDKKLSDMESVLQQASSIATSYSSTVKQAKQGSSANNQITDMVTNGLVAAKTSLATDIHNEVEITGAGIIARRMDDEGSYGNKQLKISGNRMYFTDDAWQSVSMAIGEINFNGEDRYGVLADVICGNLIAGKQMLIGNENGSVEITGDGIKITNGTITWGDGKVNAPEIKDISNLTESLNEVDLYLEQLDGRIQTFSQTTDPSTSWTTTDEKNKHIDDLWVNPNDGLTKQWTGTTWIVVTDENLKKLASSKAQIFTSQPTTPYYAGDLWVQGSTGDIMHCKTTKTSGTFDSTHWVISSKYTNNDKLYEFIDGDFADAMLDIGTKIDGKADTFYQSNSPHQEYTNITDNATYNLWVGDMWYDTDTGQTFMYQKENLGNNKYDYKWKFMDIPDEVFDIIDTKKTIYTTLPANYNKDDMYILEVDRGSWEKGTILNALTTVKEQTTATFVPSHWKENVRYTDDSYVQNWIEKDFANTISEINGQIDKRAQTWYKTKSEMDAEVATWTDKSIHVGDLWYRTDVSEGEDQTFVYTSSYTWEAMNGVPKEVFDTIDGKKSIYTSLPTNYNKDDMYILEVDRGSWEKGTILNALTTVKEQTTATFVPSHWKENVRYTDDSYVQNWIEKDFANTISEINGQIDKRVQTWYKSKTGMDAEVATWTDKSIHVGDLWYNTDEDNRVYIYNSSYIWEEMNGVPKEVFDMADGSCSLFVSKPTNYRKNDMWILDIENKSGTNSTYPKYAKGTLLVAKNDNTSYSFSDWEEQVKYSQDLSNFVAEYNTTIGNIKGQLDKKANTYYCSNSPHPEYMNISANEDYDVWEGDLWYDTDNGKTYIYQKEIMNNDKCNYLWQFMDVPKDVFDKIDGIRTIYTTLPLPTNTTANQGDLLIPDTGFTHGGVSYIAKKVYKYVGTSWVEIDYTDKTYVDEHVASELSAAKTELKEYADGTATTKTTELNQLVSKYLGLGGTTLMGSNLVVSPYIGGGYLYIKDARTTSNTGISVEINPNGTSFTGHNSNYVFNVQKNNNIIMGVTNSGSGYFNGKIIASDGEIGGWTITSDSIYNYNENTGTKVSLNTFNSYNSSILIERDSTDGFWLGLGSGSLMSSAHHGNTDYTNYGSVNLRGDFIEMVDVYTEKDETVMATYGSKKSIIITPCSIALYDKYDNGTGSNPVFGIYNKKDGNWDNSGTSEKRVMSELPIYCSDNMSVSRDVIIGGDLYVTGNVNASISVDYAKYIKDDHLMSSSQGSSLYIESASSLYLKNPNCTIVMPVSEECLRPKSPNVVMLGNNGYRWREIWCAQSSINSDSDRNLKNTIEYMSEQDKLDNFFMSLSPCTYKFNNGESGRTHFGYISQDVEQALFDNDMTAIDFAGFCKDLKMNVYTENDVEIEEPVLDENGNQEYRYSLRYGEFIALNTHMIQKLYKIVEAQQQEIKELKGEI